MVTENSHKSEGYYLFLTISIFLVSSSITSLQIIIQRFLSIVLTYHYVFVVVSLALFGLSMGSLFTYLVNDFIKKYDPKIILRRVAYVFYASLALSYAASVYINNHEIFHDSIAIYSCIFMVPFFIGGIYLAKLLRTFPEACGKLYGADLLGAACGCIGALYLLNSFSIAHAVAAVTILPFGLLILLPMKMKKGFTRNKHKGLPGIGVKVALVVVIGISVLNLPEIAIGKNPQKEIFDALHTFNGQITHSKDSALGRVDLVEFDDYPYLMDIYVDGTAGMPMYRFNGDFSSPNQAIENLRNAFPGYFPLHAMSHQSRGNALVIGSGGGRDILLAKMAGFESITAVEINREIIRIANNHSDYNGNIYNDENVTLHIKEGRTFLRSNDEKFDLIMFSLPVTNTSQGLGSYALAENFLYTVEAISEYLSHLSSNGHLVVVTHNDFELLRLLATTLEAFRKKGLSPPDTMQHLYIANSDDYPVLVVRNKKFEKNESAQILSSALQQSWFLPGSSFFPQVQFPRLNGMLLSLESNKTSVQEFVDEMAARGYDISPVTDQSPFFYKMTNDLPRSLVNIFNLSAAAVILFAVLPFLPIIYGKTKNTSKNDGTKSDTTLYFLFSIYFIMIGVGFMVLEVTMIQRFMLVLGNPVFAMSAIIFTMLVGAGLGSLASSRFRQDILHRYLFLACSLIVALSVFYILSLSTIFNYINVSTISFRVIITVILLFPLGFAMGFPLPIAIRYIKIFRVSKIIPWMLAINGASSVFGSALAIIISISYGYNQALIVAIICYSAVLLSSFRLLFQYRRVSAGTG